MLAVTTSWDDGSPDDLMLAELLAKHQFAGTFYVPTVNSEGRPTLAPTQIRALGSTFEIGGHGVNHVPLTVLPTKSCRREISDNKAYLENALGRAVDGFCLIRGKGGAREYNLARQCGYRFVRTILRATPICNTQSRTLHVSEQFYPHSAATLAKGAFRCLLQIQQPLPIMAHLAGADLVKRMEAAALQSIAAQRPLHIWGHAWEVRERLLMPILDSTLKMLQDYYPRHQRMTNGELYLEEEKQHASAATAATSTL